MLGLLFLDHSHGSLAHSFGVFSSLALFLGLRDISEFDLPLLEDLIVVDLVGLLDPGMSLLLLSSLPGLLFLLLSDLLGVDFVFVCELLLGLLLLGLFFLVRVKLVFYRSEIMVSSPDSRSVRLYLPQSSPSLLIGLVTSMYERVCFERIECVSLSTRCLVNDK